MNKSNYMVLTVSSFLFFGFVAFAFLMKTFELSPVDAAKGTGWIFGAIWIFYAIKIYLENRKP